MSNAPLDVLVVDDEWTFRQQMTRALSLVGLQCESASDGDEALERFEQHRHRLIVTDLRLPKKNGHSLAMKLLDQANPPIVVAVTGVTDSRLSSDLIQRGVADVIFKPINYFEVARQLKTLVDSTNHSDVEQSSVEKKGASDDSMPQPASGNYLPTSRRDIEQSLVKFPLPSAWIGIAFHWIDWERVPNPPNEMQQALQHLSDIPSHVSADGRSSGRAVLGEKGVALALGADHEPIGDPFKILIRDLSIHGIGFVHSEYVKSDKIAVSWRGIQRNRIVIVGKILRCRPVGAFFDVGAAIIPSQPFD